MKFHTLKYHKEFIELLSIRQNFEERTRFLNLLQKEIHEIMTKFIDIPLEEFDSNEEFVPNDVIKKVCKEFDEKFIEEEAIFLILLSKELNK